ncbi:hypothetical protein [Streptomyces griseorubiginosus]|uniref:hypothetical protein n=1 Tax=Streptomyces griseorubiginosus TaxID=67304 RepID=UPI002E822B86|nr:hypothetical protein [Streptomyces griseorubiginosus]WUB50234.1 hypothetical protein OHN19_20280 [Streptomyces griseorubiginosus]WUB58759.1 hypothetical protein OG942_20280 [Streptomyces griseorubiginosus]
MDEFEGGVFPQVRDVLGPSRTQVVEAHHRVSASQQCLTQVRAQKTAPTGYGNTHGFLHEFRGVEMLQKP